MHIQVLLWKGTLMKRFYFSIWFNFSDGLHGVQLPQIHLDFIQTVKRRRGNCVMQWRWLGAPVRSDSRVKSSTDDGILSSQARSSIRSSCPSRYRWYSSADRKIISLYSISFLCGVRLAPNVMPPYSTLYNVIHCVIFSFIRLNVSRTVVFSAPEYYHIWPPEIKNAILWSFRWNTVYKFSFDMNRLRTDCSDFSLFISFYIAFFPKIFARIVFAPSRICVVRIALAPSVGKPMYVTMNKRNRSVSFIISFSVRRIFGER